MASLFDIGLVGTGVMGQSLARNMAGHGFRVMVYDRHPEKAEAFTKAFLEAGFGWQADLKSFAASLKKPRRVLCMVTAGAPVDEVIAALKPHLSPGDMIIDGGNSLYRDTMRREAELAKSGLHFVGAGVSGGEEGALRGPSIMPGGSKASWQAMKPIWEAIAAKDFAGQPCVGWMGENGAGHYVKMVHNGIEYAIMQMMAEAYDLLKRVYGFTPFQAAEVFEDWNRGLLKSYLFEIAVPVFSREDDLSKGALLDKILDRAGQKGTGRWVAQDALERGAVLSSITEAVFARSISSFKQDRVALSKHYPPVKPELPMPAEEFTEQLGQALYAANLISYAQGFELIRLAAAEEKWSVDLAEIARLWQGGCIIRAEVLKFIHKAFAGAEMRPFGLLYSSDVQAALHKHIKALRIVASAGALSGVPVPCLSSTLSFFDAAVSPVLPANFIQGLRDFFGAHTYERTDRPGTFHTPWSDLR